MGDLGKDLELVRAAVWRATRDRGCGAHDVDERHDGCPRCRETPPPPARSAFERLAAQLRDNHGPLAGREWEA
jgi:hypothetical protein